MLKLIYPILVLSLLSFTNVNALNEDEHSTEGNPLQKSSLVTYDDWTAYTHSKKAEPDYSVVFEQNKVLRFDITIDSADWATMQTDLSNILGSGAHKMHPKRPKSSGNTPPERSMRANTNPLVMPPPSMNKRSDEQQSGNNKPEDRTKAQGKSHLGAPPSANSSKPMWIPCSFNFEGKEWYNVGLRYKGNSSLKSAFHSGNKKLSLKLDFDQFEDDYPELKNQRFYGFKQLNLNNNFDDASLMREKVGADLFRQFGLAAAQTTFCVIYLDYGTGPQYYGVYTLVEEVDNTVISTQFNDDSGNLYKPDGSAASFAAGSYNEDQLELKTNKKEADYSDVKALYDVLQSSTRTTDTEAWQEEFESIFDLDIYLRWLAANTIIQNWDTYGSMTHNYYLYDNPENHLLTWIPWDNNEALQNGKKGASSSLNYYDVDSAWPLIDYVLDVDKYKHTYDNYLQEFLDEVFVPKTMIASYDKYYNLLKNYAHNEAVGYSYMRSSNSFDRAVDDLKEHVQTRNDVANRYLK